MAPSAATLWEEEFARFLDGIARNTLRPMHRDCLGADLSPNVPRAHAPRTRTNYAIERSLAQVGVDEAWLRARLRPLRRAVEGAREVMGRNLARPLHSLLPEAHP